MANPTVALRLDDEVHQRLKTLGQRKDRSPHYLMKEAVESYLEAEEALVAEQDLMNSRWEQFELTGESLEHDKVKIWAAGLQSGSSNGSQA